MNKLKEKQMKPNYQTSLQLTEEDFLIKEKLRKNRVTIIETWRRGAKDFLTEIGKRTKPLTK